MMRSIHVLAIAALILGATSLALTESAAAEPVDPTLAAAIEQTLYRIEATGDGRYRAANPAQGLHAVIAPEGFEAVASGEAEATWRFGLGLVGLGRGEATFKLGAAGSEPKLDGTQLSFPRGPVTEWYRNDPRGLEHGFTLEARPKGGEAPLALELTVTGDLPFELSRDRDGLVFRSEGSQLVRYGSLHAFDAAGTDLPASFEIASVEGAERRVRIVVEDEGATYPLTIDPLVTTGEFKLVGSFTTTNDGLGNSLAISGDVAVVGASNAQIGANLAQGEVYIFRRTGGVWTEEQRLEASDGLAGDAFGSKLAIEGDVLIIGADRDDDPVAGADAGSAYVFGWNGTTWTEEQKITASDIAAGERFGFEVGLSGDEFVVGALLADVGANADQGALYAYHFDGSSWGGEQKLTASDGAPGDALGIALSVSGDALVAGSEVFDGSTLPGSAYVFRLTAGVWSEEQKLTASDGAASDTFGRSVSISGDLALVGALGDDDNGSNSGSAYVYRFDGSSWNEEQKLLASDGAAGDNYGRGTAIAAGRAVVGALFAGGSGQAYVYRNAGTSWIEDTVIAATDGAAGDRLGVAVAISGTDVLVGADHAGGTGGAAYLFPVVLVEDQKLLASDALLGSRFGDSVSVSGDVALVGAAWDDDNGRFSGSAYVYRWDGSDWIEHPTKLLASDGEEADGFGGSVSISGDVALVGARADDDNGNNSGSAYVYRWDGSDWIEHPTKLLASDGEGADGFGGSVSISGDVALVGVSRDDNNGNNSGSAYVYRWDGADWIEHPTKLLASDGEEADGFGGSVSISGDVALVGAVWDDDNGNNSGSAYVYRFDGSTWVEEQKLLASDGALHDLFGGAVALSGDVALVSATGDGDNDSGSAYVYRWDGADWIEHPTKLLASDGEAVDGFGVSVSVSGEMALVGALRDDDNGNDSGSAYVYRWDGADWIELSKLLATDGEANDWFGDSVSVSGDVAIVGALLDNDNGSDSGSAYTFDLGSCGDGILDSGEACDDGARVPGDGCNVVCQIETCADGLDNDGDGLTDFAGGDPGCWGAGDLSEQSGFLPCDNGFDDDADTFVDYPADPECASPSDPSEGDACSDGVDNDGDGAFDFPDDPGCASALDPDEIDPALPCDNDLDDDGDGLTDFAGGDPGCADPLDGTETDAALPCDDGLDNDGDGRTDHDPVTSASPGDTLNDPAGTGDPVCRDPWFAREDAICQDGIDNDSKFGTDYDGGRSILGAGGTDPDGGDPTCGQPWFNREAPKGCGLGFEIAPLLLGLFALRRRKVSAS